MARPLYVGVFLTPESRERLLSFVPPLYEQVTADHLTIMFKPDDLTVENMPIGKKVRLKLVGHAHDDLVQAAIVRGVISGNKDPHITISYNLEKGGKPVLSNKMLEKAFLDETNISVPHDIYLDGTIDTFPRSQTQAEGELNNG